MGAPVPQRRQRGAARSGCCGRPIRARAAATRVLCYWRDRVPDPLELLKVQANDAHPRRAPRGGPRRQLLPDQRGGRGRPRIAQPSAGSVPRVHARPDHEHAEGVHEVTSWLDHAMTVSGFRVRPRTGGDGCVARRGAAAAGAKDPLRHVAARRRIPAGPAHERRAGAGRSQARRPEVQAGVHRAPDPQGDRPRVLRRGRRRADEDGQGQPHAGAARGLVEGAAGRQRDGGQVRARAAGAAGGRHPQGPPALREGGGAVRARRCCSGPDMAAC